MHPRQIHLGPLLPVKLAQKTIEGEGVEEITQQEGIVTQTDHMITIGDTIRIVRSLEIQHRNTKLQTQSA